MPIDDILREFRIKALTTPPEAIELTTLDKDMSQVLARNDLPKDAKVKLYNDVLNKFRNVRDLLIHKEPSDSVNHQSESVSKANREIKKENHAWDLKNDQDRQDFLESLKERMRKTLLSTSDGGDIYDGFNRVGTDSEMKDALEYFLNWDYALSKPSTFFKNLNQTMLASVGEIVKDHLNEGGIEKSDWKRYFPRLDRNFGSFKQSSSIASGATASAAKVPGTKLPVVALQKISVPAAAGAAAAASSASATKTTTQKSTKSAVKNNSSSVPLASSPNTNVAYRLRSQHTKGLTGKGRKVSIDFDNWETSLNSSYNKKKKI